jgi:hypothetical protein
MMSNITFIQANLQHSIAASRVLSRTVSVKGIDIAVSRGLYQGPEYSRIYPVLRGWSLEILSRGNEPTFCSGGRLEVVAFTPGSLRRLESIIRLGCFVRALPVRSQTHFFTIRGSFPACVIRKPRVTDWDSFKEDLRDRLERVPG